MACRDARRPALFPSGAASPRDAGGRGGPVSAAACAPRRLDSLTLDAVVAQLAQLDAPALLALARHLRTRLAPSGDVLTPAVAERLVRMSAAELRKLGQRLRARLAAEAGEE